MQVSFSGQTLPPHKGKVCEVWLNMYFVRPSLIKAMLWLYYIRLSSIQQEITITNHNRCAGTVYTNIIT